MLTCKIECVLVAKVVLHLEVIPSLHGHIRSSPVKASTGGFGNSVCDGYSYFIFVKRNAGEKGREEEGAPADAQRHVVISRALDDLGARPWPRIRPRHPRKA